LSIEFHIGGLGRFYPRDFYGIISRESEKGGAKMEGSILRAYISENIEKAQRENIPSAVSKFLDSASLSAAAAIARSTAGRFIFWGGFEGAERVIMLSVPDYIDIDTERDFHSIFRRLPAERCENREG